MKSRSTETPTPPRMPRPPVRRAIDTVRDLAPAVTAISALTATIFHVLYSYRMGLPLLGELAATSFVVVTFAGMVLLVALFQFAAFFPFIALSGLDDQDQADLRAALAGSDTRKRGQWGAWADAKGFAICFGWIYWAAFLALAVLGGLAGNQGDGLLLWLLISALAAAAIAASFRLKGPEVPGDVLWRMAATSGGGVPLAFHVHAISSMTWLALLIVQQVVVQRRAMELHRLLGRASFVLFPFLIFGFVMIINLTASHYASGEGAVTMVLGPAFGIGMGIAIAAYLTLFYLALKHRRNVKLHAGYMLATPLILFESPFSRVMGDYLPWMNVIGSDFPQAILDTILLSDLIVAAFALVLWVAPAVPAITAGFAAYAALPPAVTLALGIAAGGAAAWLGWEAGRTPARPRTAAAAG